MAYRLALPPTLAPMHNVFHVSMLKIYDLEFAVGGHVFLKVTPIRGVLKFGKKG